MEFSPSKFRRFKGPITYFVQCNVGELSERTTLEIEGSAMRFLQIKSGHFARLALPGSSLAALA